MAEKRGQGYRLEHTLPIKFDKKGTSFERLCSSMLAELAKPLSELAIPLSHPTEDNDPFHNLTNADSFPETFPFIKGSLFWVFFDDHGNREDDITRLIVDRDNVSNAYKFEFELHNKRHKDYGRLTKFEVREWDRKRVPGMYTLQYQDMKKTLSIIYLDPPQTSAFYYYYAKGKYFYLPFERNPPYQIQSMYQMLIPGPMSCFALMLHNSPTECSSELSWVFWTWSDPFGLHLLSRLFQRFSKKF